MFRISVSAVHTSALFAGVLIVLVFTGVGRGARPDMHRSGGGRAIHSKRD